VPFVREKTEGFTGKNKNAKLREYRWQVEQSTESFDEEKAFPRRVVDFLEHHARVIGEGRRFWE